MKEKVSSFIKRLLVFAEIIAQDRAAVADIGRSNCIVVELTREIGNAGFQEVVLSPRVGELVDKLSELNHSTFRVVVVIIVFERFGSCHFRRTPTLMKRTHHGGHQLPPWVAPAARGNERISEDALRTFCLSTRR
jgi:hypothetical protein